MASVLTRTRVLVALLALLGCEHAASKKPEAIVLARTTPQVMSECPDEMALVTSDGGKVCVDRYEAAIEGGSYSRPPAGRDARTMRAIAAKGIKPQVNIDETQAEAACQGASKRLCTAREWTAACRGPQNLVYPYGNDHVAGACNEGRPSPVRAGPDAAALDDPRLAEGDDGVLPGGASPRCVTAAGVYDMHGNVHEWVSDSSKPGDPRFGMFLGGFFADAVENGAGCSYRTTVHVKAYHDYSTGFRCCKEAR